MKAKLPLLRAARRVAGNAGAALLGCAVLASTMHAQNLQSPVGNIWDCVISGKGQKGVAFITFFDDHSFSGYQILSGARVPVDADVEARNPGGDVGRYEDPLDHSGTNVFIFGFDSFSGRWEYDAKGRVIGNFMQVTDGEDGSVDTITNSVSFTAKVVSGVRMNMVSSTGYGSLTYKGKPYSQILPSLNGAWYATKKVGNQINNDFFSLTSTADDNPWSDTNPDLSTYPGIYYTLDGQGGSYDFGGFALLSSQKKVAFAFESFMGTETNGVLSASFGSFASKNGALKASAKGVDPITGGYTYTAMQPLGID